MSPLDSRLICNELGLLCHVRGRSFLTCRLRLALGTRNVDDKSDLAHTRSLSPTHLPPTTSSTPQFQHPSVEATYSFYIAKLINKSSTMADWQTDAGGHGVAVPHDASDNHQESSTFDTATLAGALNDVDEAAFKDRAQEAGWVNTIPVNYNLQQSNREDELAAYAASSAVYEWDDEYGDVGPEVPQLEEQLFNNAFRLRQGKHMSNLQLEVTVEGPDKIHPVRSVSLPNTVILSH